MIVAAVCFAMLASSRVLSSPANERAAPEVSRIAVVDVLTVVESLFQSERYTPARKKFQDEQAAAMSALRDELSAMETRGSAMASGSPEQQALIEQYQAKRESADMIRVNVEEFNTNQIAEAYRVAIETAGALADKRGYTHVLASRTDTGRYIRSSNSAEAVQEILARPVLKCPAGDDITADVLKELKVEAVKASEPAGEPGAGKK